MVVDTMKDEFLTTYLAHPERFYAFCPDRSLGFKAQPEGATYKYVSTLIANLDSYRGAELRD